MSKKALNPQSGNESRMATSYTGYKRSGNES